VIDVGGAAAALVVLAPVLGACAALVRALDGAPVLFRQQRLGLGGRPFSIVKLRTMRDGRPTRLGARLRELGVDELPQLVNVLRGDMSLVGPRPLTANDVRRLGWDAPRYAARWSVRPGLTGPAQIAPVRRCDPRISFLHDRHYARHAGLATDLGVLAASALVAVAGKRRARAALRAVAR
jgi:lipopolysaccharide/colanic/teichoic acid biosynthesis glycosyltransferase